MALKTIESGATSWNIVRQIRIQNYKTQKRKGNQSTTGTGISEFTLNKSDGGLKKHFLIELKLNFEPRVGSARFTIVREKWSESEWQRE